MACADRTAASTWPTDLLNSRLDDLSARAFVFRIWIARSLMETSGFRQEFAQEHERTEHSDNLAVRIEHIIHSQRVVYDSQLDCSSYA